MHLAAARRRDREGGELRDLGIAALVTAFGQAWIEFDVYMPECWAKDPQRRAQARIPGRLTFATKPELAVEQAKRLMKAGIRVMWAAADKMYGRFGELRAALRTPSLAYVVIITGPRGQP